MKKAYESPIMMIENFVANEYVASCYDIYCRGTHDVDSVISDRSIVHSEDKHDTHGKIARVTSYTFTNTAVEHSPWGLGWINTRTYNAATYNGHWRVEAVNVATTAHPNASV